MTSETMMSMRSEWTCSMLQNWLGTGWKQIWEHQSSFASESDIQGRDTDIETENQLATARRIKAEHATDDDISSIPGRQFSDATLLRFGHCSNSRSGQNSELSSMGVDLSGQLFWQFNRGSLDYSPKPSSRTMTPSPCLEPWRYKTDTSQVVMVLFQGMKIKMMQDAI